MNKKKLMFPLLIASLSFSIISGCEKKEIVASADDKPIVKEAKGVFLGKTDAKHFKMELDNKQKLVETNKTIDPILENMDAHETFTFSYIEDDVGAIKIKSIKGSTVRKTQEEPAQPKEEKKKEETSKTPSLSNVSFTNTEDMNIKEQNESKLLWESKEDSRYQVKAETVPSDRSVEKLRWDASSELKTIGTLNEWKKFFIPNEKMQDSEFVFHASNQETNRIIIVKSYGDKLLRYTLSYPSSDQSKFHDSLVSKLWDSIAKTNS